MSQYILIVLFVSGGFTAEFHDRVSCQEAAQAIAVAYGKGAGYIGSFCQPTGAPQGGRK
jgi:hypothetical protein